MFRHFRGMTECSRTSRVAKAAKSLEAEMTGERATDASFAESRSVLPRNDGAFLDASPCFARTQFERRPCSVIPRNEGMSTDHQGYRSCQVA